MFSLFKLYLRSFKSVFNFFNVCLKLLLLGLEIFLPSEVHLPTLL